PKQTRDEAMANEWNDGSAVNVCLARVGINPGIIGIPVNPIFLHGGSRLSRGTSRKSVAVIAHVKHKGQSNLLDITETINLLRFGFGSRQSGQEQARQNSNDGDHYQQLNQGERSPNSNNIGESLARFPQYGTRDRSGRARAGRGKKSRSFQALHS